MSEKWFLGETNIDTDKVIIHSIRMQLLLLPPFDYMGKYKDES